jgi:predicted MarR family transcription regulator
MSHDEPVLQFGKKLVARGYVKSEKTGKEVFFSVTPAGRDLCLKYKEVRESRLIT